MQYGDMEREHELLAQSRKVMRKFSLSKSFTEQLSLLIPFLLEKIWHIYYTSGVYDTLLFYCFILVLYSEMF